MTVTRPLPRFARRLTVVVASGLLLATAAAASAAAPAADLHTSAVARFGPRDGSFVESVALDGRGNMYASKTVWGQQDNAGRIVRVRPSGAKHGFGPRFDLGPTGMLVGVAVNARDQVFVARYDFGKAARSEIVRVTPGRLRTVATLPAGSWPNGLAFHQGMLYVGDAALGDVWRFRPSTKPRDLTRPWLHDVRLTPAHGQDIGVNGLAFAGDDLFAVNSTRNTLLRERPHQDGTPGPVERVVKLARLHTADGITFDRQGRLWVTVNGTGKVGHRHGQRLLRLSPGGTVQRVVEDAAWMDYPTSIARGRTPATAHRMFVVDGAFNGGAPDLRSFHVG